MNETAMEYWALAQAWLQAADEATDVNSTIALTSQAECAVKLARFAAEFLGPDVPQPNANSPVPQYPTQGPKVWGAPT